VHIDLEAEGYEVESLIIPACAVDAPHRRDRVWIVAHSSRKQLEKCLNPGGEKGTHSKPTGSDQSVPASKIVANPESVGIQRLRASWIQESHSYECKRLSLRQSEGSKHSQWLPEPDVGRVAHGIPNRTHRLKGLGNAIVPQVAAEIIRCIVEVSK
jgi:DNA (cytosine-5)-methyltransferase 1